MTRDHFGMGCILAQVRERFYWSGRGFTGLMCSVMLRPDVSNVKGAT